MSYPHFSDEVFFFPIELQKPFKNIDHNHLPYIRNTHTNVLFVFYFVNSDFSIEFFSFGQTPIMGIKSSNISSIIGLNTHRVTKISKI